MRAKPPRIPLLPADEARRAAEAGGVAAAVAELNVFRVLLRHPALAKRIADLLLELMLRGHLDARLRELVILRLGWATGSDYEWTQHWRIAGDLGLPAHERLAVREWRTAPVFGPGERAVLAATDETLERGTISPETWAECARHLGGTEALLELAAVIGTWRCVSSLLRSLGVPLEAGVASWPPDGRGPLSS